MKNQYMRSLYLPFPFEIWDDWISFVEESGIYLYKFSSKSKFSKVDKIYIRFSSKWISMDLPAKKSF